MKAIGKITVKHFLNTTLGAREGIVTDDEKYYPLYLKIIFMRKTTQIKSSISDGHFYATIEDAYNKLGDKLKAEIKMVEDIISREYQRLDDKFELKGLGQKCNAYQLDLNGLVFEQYLWRDFFKVVARSNSEYKRLLLTRFPRTPVITHYHAALKLMDKNEELLKLKDQFENYSVIEKCLQKIRVGSYVTLFDWTYGSHRDKFSYTALKEGVSFNKVSQFVTIIDGIVSNHVEKS